MLASEETVKSNRQPPSASLGVFAGSFLSHPPPPTVHAALQGVHAQHILILSQKLPKDDTFELLEKLGGAATLSIPGLLNRSTDRRTSLEHYLTELREAIGKGKQKEKELEGKTAMLKQEHQERRGQVRDIERTLRRAMKQEEYAEVGTQQEELTRLESDLQQVKMNLDNTRDAAKILEKLIATSQERLVVIEQNRELLIAGLSITDVPGLEELGVVRRGGRTRGHR